MTTIAQNDPVIKRQDRLIFILKVSGAENIRDIDFNINMLGSNTLIRSKSSNPRIYFTTSVKYSDKLLQEANVPLDPATFVDPVLFLKLLRYGKRAQSREQSDDIEKNNIDFMINLLFKKTKSIYLRQTRFVISNVDKGVVREKKQSIEQLQTISSNRLRNTTSANVYIKYIVDVNLDILKDTGSLSWIDYQRKPCSEKLKEIKGDFVSALGIQHDSTKKTDSVTYKSWKDYYPHRDNVTKDSRKRREEERKRIAIEKQAIIDAHREALVRKEIEKIEAEKKTREDPESVLKLPSGIDPDIRQSQTTVTRGGSTRRALIKKNKGTLRSKARRSKARRSKARRRKT